MSSVGITVPSGLLALFRQMSFVSGRMRRYDPVIDLGAEGGRQVVEGLVGRVLGDHMVARGHEGHDRAEVGPSAAVHLEDVVRLDMAVEARDLLLELRRALDPAVVQLGASDLREELLARLRVERYELIGRQARDGALCDIPDRIALVVVQERLDPDGLDLHEMPPFTYVLMKRHAGDAGPMPASPARNLSGQPLSLEHGDDAHGGERNRDHAEHGDQRHRDHLAA